MTFSPEQGNYCTRCTTKMFALSPHDRPADWSEQDVLDQAENVKPCSISIEQANEDLKLRVEDTSKGEVFFQVSLPAAGYQIHRTTWHSVNLPDTRRFGLSLVEGPNLEAFLQALHFAIRITQSGSDDPDGPVENHHVRHLGVAGGSHKKKLNLDVSRASTSSLQYPTSNLSSIPSAMASMGVTSLKGGVGELVEKLQQAVLRGDADTAQQVARQLACMKVSLDVKVNIDQPEPRDKEIPVKVYIEDRLTSGGSIVLNLKPSIKISDLKIKILINYGFAPETQKWIIGKRIATDGQTLEQCGVTTPNTPIFLYIMSIKTIGLTKEEIAQRYGKLLAKANSRRSETAVPRTPGSSGMPPVTTPLTPPATFAQQAIQKVIAETAMPIDATPPPTHHAPTQPQTPEPAKPTKYGWPCEACTLLNLWTRRACNVCFADRPAHMKCPPDAVIPPAELARIAEANAQEEQAKQMQPQPAESDPSLLTLRQNDLDLMLRLITDARASENQQEAIGRNEDYNSYNDNLPDGDDLPDGFEGGSQNQDVSVDPDLVVDCPDSPGSNDDNIFTDMYSDNRHSENTDDKHSNETA